MSKTDVLENIINTFAGGNKTAFARAIGILPQSLQGWLQRGKIEYDVIFKAYPSINPVWMLTNGEEGDITDVNFNPHKEEDENAEIIALRAENDVLREVIGLRKKTPKSLAV